MKTRQNTPAKRARRRASSATTRASFAVVGIGASAGGLEALERFLGRVPANSGMAFVIVQHLDPTHKGSMPELLQRVTGMNVVQVRDRTKVRPAPQLAASLQSVADQLILQHYAPPAVLANDKGDILYISGRTGKYLEPTAGRANWNVFAMTREGLRRTSRHPRRWKRSCGPSRPCWRIPSLLKP